jgi:hypothetical protein
MVVLELKSDSSRHQKNLLFWFHNTLYLLFWPAPIASPVPLHSRAE